MAESIGSFTVNFVAMKSVLVAKGDTVIPVFLSTAGASRDTGVSASLEADIVS
jgi:hypothetical protein